MNRNCQSDVGRLKSVLIKHARDAFVSQGAVDRQWRDLNYTQQPSFEAAVEEYDRFAAVLTDFDIELHFLPQDASVGLDSIYPRDASIVCEKGAILCNMGKAARDGVHTESELWPLVKLTPSAANRSRFGVWNFASGFNALESPNP